MHVIVVWDYDKDLDQNGRQNANFTMRACLEGFSWVRPFSIPFFIVEVNSVERRTRLRKALINACQTLGNVNVLISPLLPDGQYGGWLPKSMWEKINKRTGQVEK